MVNTTLPERNDDVPWADNVKKHDGRDRLWTGIMLVIAGGALLAKSFDVPLPIGLFSWQSLLIVLGILNGIRNKFQNSTWFILILIGSAFLINDFYFNFRLRQNFWALIVICIGAFFILRPRRGVAGKSPDQITTGDKEARWKRGAANSVDINILFSGANKRFASPDFAGGRITSIFGGAKLNLTESDIRETAIIELNVICGGVELIVPADWTIKSNITSVLASVDDRRIDSPLLKENPGKVLILEGSAIFGGIEIKSFGK